MPTVIVQVPTLPWGVWYASDFRFVFVIYIKIQLDLQQLLQNDSAHLLSLISHRYQQSIGQAFLCYNKWTPDQLLSWWRLLEVILFLVWKESITIKA